MEMAHRLGPFDRVRANQDSEVVWRPQVFASGQMLRMMTSPPSLTVKALGTDAGTSISRLRYQMVKNSEIHEQNYYVRTNEISIS